MDALTYFFNLLMIIPTLQKEYTITETNLSH